MHRETTKDLIEKAKRKAGISGGVTVAIDIMESNLYRMKAKLEFDLPIVLDGLPVYRGMRRVDIVDQLLEKATDMIDVELLLMDREFAHDAVKDVCEDHDVWYLNPGVMRTSEKATCARLRQAGELVHIERDESPSSTFKRERRTLSDFVGDDRDDEEGDGLVRKQSTCRR